MTVNLRGFEQYLLDNERPENTIACYKQGVVRYFQMFDKISNANIVAFKKALIDKNKPSTVNARLSGIAAYAKYMNIKINRPKAVRVPKQLSVENVITAAEFDTLCNGLLADGNMRGYWIVMYLAKTGARVNEFRLLKKTALERGYDEMWNKGKIRRIYIPAKLIEGSREYFDGVAGDYLFPAINPGATGGPMTTRGIGLIINGFAKKYNIRKEVMHAHGFRHFYAKMFLQNGGDLTLLSDLLGHSTVGTTAIYTRRSSEEMAEEISKVVMGGNSVIQPKAPPSAYNLEQIVALQQETIKAQKEAINVLTNVLQRS